MKSERSNNRTPNDKVSRYLQRIEKLVGTKNRSPSPISGRTSKSQSINTLDHFLKFQLTFKILSNYLERVTQRHLIIFFNNLRSYQNKQPQTVYRFVSIQKQKCTHMDSLTNSKNTKIDGFSTPHQTLKQSTIMNIDTDISTKLMIAALKNCFKSRIREYFNQIVNFQNQTEKVKTQSNLKQPLTSQRIQQSIQRFVLPSILLSGILKLKIALHLQISFFKIKTVTQHPLKANQYENRMNKEIINLTKLLENITQKRVSNGFYKIKQYDVNTMYIKQMDFIQAEFSLRNFQHMIGRYVGYFKWKTIYTITSLSKKYVIANAYQVQLNQQKLITQLKQQKASYQITQTHQIYNSCSNLLIVQNAIMNLYRKQIQRSFGKLKQYYLRLNISLLQTKLGIQKMNLVVLTKIRGYMRQSFLLINLAINQNQGRKQKQKREILLSWTNMSEILNRFQRILYKKILEQKQAFYQIKKTSVEELTLQKLETIITRLIKAKYYRKLKIVDKSWKVLQILQQRQHILLRDSFEQILSHNQKIKVNKIMSIFSKIDKRIIFGTIQAFMILKIRQVNWQKQNIREDFSCQISAQNLQFLHIRQNSQIEFQSKLNRLKQSILTKRKF